MPNRSATHAGQWYSSSEVDLVQLLTDLLAESKQKSSVKSTRAIICPHAGFRYSGKTAAAAYASFDPTHVRRVFLLGPCHHVYVEGCALPETTLYETPLGGLSVDLETVNELRNNSGEFSFKTFRLKDDENEHSIEMQLPWLKFIFKNSDVKIVPIYVGSFLNNEERTLGRILTKYFDDPSTLFVVSSDFCHYGARFRYTPSVYPSREVCLKACSEMALASVYPVESTNGKVESLDRQGMHLIERQDAEGFAKYLHTTGNTICGRWPIQLLLEVIRNSKMKLETSFVHYSQSNLLSNDAGGLSSKSSESCVSYAAGISYSVQ